MDDRDDCFRLFSALFLAFPTDYNQLNSYNEFVLHVLKTLGDVTIQDVPAGDGRMVSFRFGNVTFRKPVLIEDDMREVKLTPKLARLRRENYCARMYVDVHVFTLRNAEVKLTPEIVKLGMLRRKSIESDTVEDDGTEQIEIAGGVEHRVQPKVYFTAFPVPVGSVLCWLNGLPTERLQQLGEMIYEPGGYYLMRGKERVVVSQKNMPKNTFFIAKRKGVFEGTMHCLGIFFLFIQKKSLYSHCLFS